MNNAIDIKLNLLILSFSILTIPVFLTLINKINIIKELMIAVVRMTIQLFLVGIVLQYVFKFNFLWLTSIWLIIMILIADINILVKTGLTSKKYLFLFLYFAIFLSITLILSILLFVIIRPTPLYDAKHLIPISGMLLGNSMNGMSLAIERFYNGIKKNKKEYYSYISMGATTNEAIEPFLKQSYKAALMPTIATMTTLGIVSLPGMMTGQILGGSPPLVAIKYQILIMIGIFSATSISSIISIKILSKTIINRYGIILE